MSPLEWLARGVVVLLTLGILLWGRGLWTASKEVIDE